jgi:TonB-linked SusC/RagA family outer membrane protein
MKKIRNLYPVPWIKSLRYYLMHMTRIFILVISLGISSAFATTTEAQTKMDIKVSNVSLEQLFKEIQHKSEYIFFYRDDVWNYKVTLELKKSPVSAILDQALLHTNLTYKIAERQIVIMSKKDKMSLNMANIQQEREITGTVVDSSGTPLLGASVIIKGTSQGTATDFDGNFKITVPNDSSMLVVTYIGYKDQEVSVVGLSHVNVTMVADNNALEEIVVIGYGTEKKSLVSDAVSTISAKQIKDLPVPSVDGLLQGQAAGVQVNQNSGTPGGEMSVRIRGLTSISGSSQPLYIIDGIPVTTGDYAQIGYSGQGSSALTDLNPNNIESISILKDASATAIYGARGSNGIVLITTKRGKQQETSIGVNIYTGMQRAWNKLDMLNAREWKEYRNDLTNSTVFTEDEINDNTIDTDWQDVIFRVAPINSYGISATGGSEKTKFFMSGTYLQQEGILIGTDYDRFNFRANVDHQLSDKVKIGTSIGLSYAHTDRVESDQTLHGPLPNGISTPAIYPVYNPDGSYNQEGPYSNPVSIANEAINENFSYRTNSNVFLDWTILDDLTFSSKLGVDFLDFREHAFESTKTIQGAKYNGLGFETYSNISNIVSNNLLEYNKRLNKHKIGALLGYSFEKRNYRSSFIRGQDFADDDLE